MKITINKETVESDTVIITLNDKKFYLRSEDNKLYIMKVGKSLKSGITIKPVSGNLILIS
jgi:hypothetical protein